MLGAGGGNLYGARQAAKDLYGENHPVTKALITSTGTGGGFIVAPDQMNEIIEIAAPEGGCPRRARHPEHSDAARPR